MISDVLARLHHIKTMEYEELVMNRILTTGAALTEAEEWATLKVKERTAALKTQVATMMAQKVLMFGMIWATQKFAKNNAILAGAIGAVTGALIGYTIVLNAKKQIEAYGAWAAPAVIATTAIFMGIFNAAMTISMSSSSFDTSGLSDYEMGELEGDADLGGRAVMFRQYDTGGRVGERGHFPVMVESGETIIPKTQNMLNGGAGGVTINISGDVYDGDNFAEKVGQALPNALRGVSDVGGL